MNEDQKKGVLIGLGLGAAGALAVSVFSTAGRPVAKALIKATLLAFEKGMDKFAELSEDMEDLVAEVQSEIAEKVGDSEDASEAPAPQRATADTTPDQ